MKTEAPAPVTVGRGDTLAEVAKKAGVDRQTLIELNKLKAPYALKAGPEAEAARAALLFGPERRHPLCGVAALQGSGRRARRLQRHRPEEAGPDRRAHLHPRTATAGAAPSPARDRPSWRPRRRPSPSPTKPSRRPRPPRRPAPPRGRPRPRPASAASGRRGRRRRRLAMTRPPSRRRSRRRRRRHAGADRPAPGQPPRPCAGAPLPAAVWNRAVPPPPQRPYAVRRSAAGARRRRPRPRRPRAAPAPAQAPATSRRRSRRPPRSGHTAVPPRPPPPATRRPAPAPAQVASALSRQPPSQCSRPQTQRRRRRSPRRARPSRWRPARPPAGQTPPPGGGALCGAEPALAPRRADAAGPPPCRPSIAREAPSSQPPMVVASAPVTQADIVAAGRGRFIWPVRGEILSGFGAKAGAASATTA